MGLSTEMLKLPAKVGATALLLFATATGGLTFHAGSASASTAASNPLDLLSSFPHHSSLSSSSSFPATIGAVFDGVSRSSRAIATVAVVVMDYKFSFRRLSRDSDDYPCKLSEVHLRSAKRVLKLCEINKGFYVKAGQFVAAMRQVPREYASTLSSLQDKAVPCPFKAIRDVLVSNLGQDLTYIFHSFDEDPIAAASIAQVHRAVLRDCREVAVKVQYPGLERQMKLDTKIMSFLSKSIAWLFPEYRFDWLVEEFVKAVSLELDFTQESKNAERTAENFISNDKVKVPKVVWDLTTRQVLTMEFCQGNKVDDVEFLKKMGIDPTKVAKALLEVFAEMIFVHGFVHGDPHPGNILVSPEGQSGFSLVLLDHGVYKQLDERFRLDYCELWKVLILLDSVRIQQLSERFGVGKYSRYFPLIFTGRTIDSKSDLGKGMSVEEKRSLKEDLKSLSMEDISSFMESLPPDFLIILRTDGLLRATIRELGASQRLRLLTYGKFALYGLGKEPKSQSASAVKASFSKLEGNLRYLQFRVILGLLELVSWMGRIRRLLIGMIKHRWQTVKGVQLVLAS